MNKSSVLSGSILNSRSDSGAVAEVGVEMVGVTEVILGTVTVGRRCGDCMTLVAAEPPDVLGSSTRLLKGEKLDGQTRE